MNKRLLAAACGTVLLPLSAHAAIVNISAADGVGTEVTFGPGLYSISWIGTADGGLYDSAGGIALCNGCNVGFSNAFAARDSSFGSSNFEVGIFTTRSVYGSAAAALAAYQAGTPIYHDWAHVVNGVVTSGTDGLLANPWIADPEDGTYHLVVFDADGTRTNNTGGISLRIDRVGDAVPEPATWAMMLAGFGAVGAAMRRARRRTVRFSFT